MKFHIDRDLPIPIRLQLKGLIEYGIAGGELQPGEPLPSVRELADMIGVAPMTVSQVYRELKSAGLIDTRPGSGTFVTANTQASMIARPEAALLRQHIDALIDEGLAMGLGSSELSALVNARLFYRTSLGRSIAVVMVGLFAGATASYARYIAARIGGNATVAPMTLDAIQRDSELKARAGSADLAITFAYLQREVVSLLPNTRVVSIAFIPSEETRRALASLDSRLTVGVISRFPNFLPIMKAGVMRFAPHVADIVAATLDTPEMTGVLEEADVIIYATGAEGVLPQIGPETPAIEYRHSPDPADIERVVLPIIRSLGADFSPEEQEAS
ncbi:GntR family transcriptional regulator [Radicibacter daui]|uniref:GntR family transcriptional regulator n=1 Tax=Radicibacter daui TaxID=3064829 RepID=UPI004046C26F